MSNRLSAETSPYLLQHAENPVDWHPWGPEALDRARSEDKPIFLSVGYSTCYWCHVMERESFEDEATAALMNEGFVNIKVDREERPDLDEIYMVATQVMAGQGGWPNSLFLTPDLEPYFAGTYFPPSDQHGRPGFPTVLRSMRDAWVERRDDVHEQAKSVAKAIRHYLEERAQPSSEVPAPGAAESALADLTRRYDPQWGGFGVAPKFPTPSNLLLLEAFLGEHPQAEEILVSTLDQMARGGIYDQVGGGFHRYATDREWKIPHFEKMLYDNGWLMELYARHFERTGEDWARRVVEQTAEFLDREMTAPEGGFRSALDAETDGHEGAFYVWTRAELDAALGAEDSEYLAPILGYDQSPFFERTQYVIHFPEPLAAQAQRRRMAAEELVAEVDAARSKLFAARAARPALRIDDKVLADWNGMMIGGFAEAARALDEPKFAERAARAARFVLDELRDGEGVLQHAWLGGKARIDAFLGDYVFMVRGLLALHRATGGESWLAAAVELTDQQTERLLDPEDGGFFVAAPAEDLLVRSKEVFEGAVPSANGIAVDNLLTLAEATGEERFRGLAERSLLAFGELAAASPASAMTLCLAARRFAGDGVLSSSEDGAIVRPVLWADLERGAGTLRLVLEIAEGWHLGAAVDPAEAAGETDAAATTLELEGGEVLAARLPEPESWQGGESLPSISILRGRVEIVLEVEKVRRDARLRLTYQACDDSSCRAPETVELAL